MSVILTVYATTNTVTLYAVYTIRGTVFIVLTIKYTIQDRESIMIDKLALIRFNTHSVHITRDVQAGLIHCFKYNSIRTRCDMATFDNDEAASDYILEPLPALVWEVTVEET